MQIRLAEFGALDLTQFLGPNLPEFVVVRGIACFAEQPNHLSEALVSHDVATQTNRTSAPTTARTRVSLATEPIRRICRLVICCAPYWFSRSNISATSSSLDMLSQSGNRFSTPFQDSES